MFITITDFHNLMGLLEMAKLKNKLTPVMEKLLKDLPVARHYSQVAIPKNIVTMNSKVMLQSTDGQQLIITLTYPHHADPAQKRISVFSRQGAPLLGAKEGDPIGWEVANEVFNYQIKKVLYQPEAEGHFHL